MMTMTSFNINAVCITAILLYWTGNDIKSCRTVSEVGGKNVSRGDQQLFAQMCHFLRTHCQQS